MSKQITYCITILLIFSLSFLLLTTGCDVESNSSPNPNPNINLSNIVLEKDENISQLLKDNSSIVDDVEHNLHQIQNNNNFSIKEYTGRLGNQVDFDFDNILSITVSPLNFNNMLSDTPIELSDMYKQFVTQNLFWLDLSLASVDSPVISSELIEIRLNTNDNTYVILYDLTSNLYLIGEHYYYADHEVVELMHYLFKPNSILSKLEHFHLLADEAKYATQVNTLTSPINYDLIYGVEKFLINGLDYNGWYEKIVKQPQLETAQESNEHIFRYEFNNVTDTVVPIIINDKEKFIFSDAFYFYGDSFSTSGGIKIGLTKTEVLGQLGVANLETDAIWSYLQGDYLKFHLYFENDVVQMISLTMP